MKKHTITAAALGAAAIGTAHAGTFTLTERGLAAGMTAIQIPVDFPFNKNMLAGGAAGDFNRDGYQDLYIIAGGPDRDCLYINNGDGTFTEQGAAWGILAGHFGAGVAVGDYDGNGYLDVYVTSHGSPTVGWAPGQNRLYRNNGDDSFTEVAAAAGVNVTTPFIGDGFGPAFGDYDLDGDLDLAVPGWINFSGCNKLFRNNGDGAFTDVTAAAIPFNLSNVRGFAVRFTDMDGDRYPELLWVADFFTSKYFKNDGDGTFTEMTAAAGVGLDSNGMGNTTGDFNGDGLLDWYVTSIYQDGNATTDGNKLYINQGDHVYAEVAETSGIDDGGWGWGTTAIDIDHDADLDIVATNGWHESEWVGEASRIYLNDGNLNFSEVALARGLDHLSNGRGLIHLDLENDGDLDLVICTHGERPYLYRNAVTGPDANWIRIFFDTSAHPDLAPDGFGTRLDITTGAHIQHRYLDGGSNYLAVSELSVHAGLGAAKAVDEINVEWANGRINRYTNVAANQTITLQPCFLDGDANGDRAVNFDDLNLTLANWGQTASPWRDGDVNGDGLVDFEDLNLILSAWDSDC
ncbi:MAG: FG-GAP-like repeat-containing protein [Phycisphaerales bacterium]